MKKSIASLALSASLLGGGVVGAAMFAPTLAGAQDEVEQVEPAETHRQNVGDRLAEVLAPLVEDGTLTQAQADIVVDTVSDARAEAREARGEARQARRADRLGNLAEATGIDADALTEGFQNGDTLAEIAEANGLATDDLIDILVAEANERLDDAVEDGRITSEQADERRELIEERVTDRVNGERPEGRRGGGRGFGRHGGANFGGPGFGGPGGADDGPDA